MIKTINFLSFTVNIPRMRSSQRFLLVLARVTIHPFLSRSFMCMLLLMVRRWRNLNRTKAILCHLRNLHHESSETSHSCRTKIGWQLLDRWFLKVESSTMSCHEKTHHNRWLEWIPQTAYKTTKSLSLRSRSINDQNTIESTAASVTVIQTAFGGHMNSQDTKIASTL